MKAALTRQPMPETPNLAKWLHHAGQAVFRLEQEGPLDGNLSLSNQLSQLNVLVQLEHLMSYPVVRDRVASGALRLSGWLFNIATGDMFAYQRESRAFTAIDRETAEHLIERLVPNGT